MHYFGFLTSRRDNPPDIAPPKNPITVTLYYKHHFHLCLLVSTMLCPNRRTYTVGAISSSRSSTLLDMPAWLLVIVLLLLYVSSGWRCIFCTGVTDSFAHTHVDMPVEVQYELYLTLTCRGLVNCKILCQIHLQTGSRSTGTYRTVHTYVG